MELNPFLSMSESGPPAEVTALNPFAGGDVEWSDTVDGSDLFVGDNPFATSNPFADIAVQSPHAGDTVPTDIFGAQDAEPSERPCELSLAPATQHLIRHVTGQMDATSSHLLDRLPPTRTPSPVSARDLHTPEPEHDAPELPPDIERDKPPRPPPARPLPPRPAPLPPPDDVNLFAPAARPTTAGILSLYSAPRPEERQPDFLSDDVVQDDCSVERETPMELGTPDTTSPDREFEAAPDSPTVPQTSSFPEMSPFREASPCAESSPFPEVSSFPVAAECPGTTQFPEQTSYPEGAKFPDSSPFPENTQFSETSHFPETAENPEHSPFPKTAVYSEQSPFLETAKFPEHSPFPETTQLSKPSCYPETAPFSGTSPFPETTSFIESSPFSGADIFSANETDETSGNPFSMSAPPQAHQEHSELQFEMDSSPQSGDLFDAFSAKFESASAGTTAGFGAWGDTTAGASQQQDGEGGGFESETFDTFLNMSAPPPAPAVTPRLGSLHSQDSGDDSFSLFIRPKESGEVCRAETAVPPLAPPPRPIAAPAPPPRSPGAPEHFATSPRSPERRRSGGSTPPTPLFDEDVSAPLEPFPRTVYDGPGWEMQLRQPNKKKITGQRFWKKVFVRLVRQGDGTVVQLYGTATDREPFQELPLQACYSVSEVGAQQFDQFGKIFTVKLQYVFYKERPGVRPGQVTKAERLTNKLSQFAAYAIQGDYQGVKEFGSDLRKLGLPVEHAPQVSQLFKLGSLSYEDVKQFSSCVEEALFRLPAQRDRALVYKLEELQLTAVDELFAEQDATGAVTRQVARVRLFFLGFLSGMPDVELGVNDLRRQGREVVGRHDIIPVATEEWIRVEDQEFHACVQPGDFLDSQIIKFKPPDACYIELMRFRVRPPKNRELPLQLKAVWCVTGNKVELRADVLVPGFASRALGQVPCEDVSIRFPIPECWIYLFRVEKHFRYGSVKSAHRRTGKIKGIERFLGAVDTLQESLIEVTSGQAKYEHHHRAIVWRMPRLPKEGQGAYTSHNLVCRMALTSYDQIPAELAPHALVEFTMPATQVSHMVVRSVSLQAHDGPEPPEKCVRYLARHEYRVAIERTSGGALPAYSLTARPEPPAAKPAATPEPPAAPAPPSSDSDSD